MGKTYDKDLSAKLKILADHAFSGTDIQSFEKRIEPDLVSDGDRKYYAAFIAVCDTKKRAQVFHASGLTLEEAMDNTTKYALDGVKKMLIEPKWVKLEIITHSEEVDPQDAVNRMFSSYHEFFRRGISLDKKYEYAYTEGEINGNRLLNYKESVLDLRSFNSYSMKRDDDVILKTPRTLILFDTDSWFIDEKDRTYTLFNKGLQIGRREMGMITPKDVKKIVGSAMHYLSGQLHPDGSFNYGYYPISKKLIPGYNIMRHSSTLWSLVCSTEIEKNPEVYKTTQAAIKYMISQIEHFDDGTAYLVEKGANEIKLGGNGVAIITLSQYMKVYETDEYVKLCQELGRGILKMMNPDGTFAHVLNADTRELKEQFRTVYYDGEATFALCRLHSMTGSSLWLEAARRSVDHFIEADYTTHRDHWVAYAVNELTMYIKEEKYYEFALRNLFENLDMIRTQPTTYHTYLELLMAGYETYRRMVDEKAEVAALKKYNIHKLADTIFVRAEHMLNGYGYPEYVMYLPEPSKYKGTFFVRHDGFRVRIDDVQHFCGAYIAFYRHYDEIRALRGIEESKQETA
ncbi:MAG: hypothetical protein K6F54_00125 [Lachnospiraceae bacterium]|nr:hypothetical protein [Lachnospiraceae bacterium]